MREYQNYWLKYKQYRYYLSLLICSLMKTVHACHEQKYLPSLVNKEYCQITDSGFIVVEYLV